MSRQLLKQALDMLLSANVSTGLVWPRHDLCEEIKAELEKPEPVACEQTIKVPKNELQWLLKCSNLQMSDGDTAREMAERWLNGKSAIDIIDGYEKLY